MKCSPRASAALHLLATLAVMAPTQSEVLMAVYQGHINLATQPKQEIVSGDLVQNAPYTLEIREMNPTAVDYFLKNCYVHNGETFLTNGCLICTSRFLSMIETTDYNRPLVEKRSLIHFVASRPNMHLRCDIEELPPGAAERACHRGGTGGILPLRMYSKEWSAFSGAGWPWWVWLLLLLPLLLLLLCCCILIPLFFWRRAKQRQQHNKMKETHITVGPPLPLPRTLHEDKCLSVQTSLAGSSVQDQFSVRESAFDQAQMRTNRTQNNNNVEVHGGQAGLYDLRDQGRTRYEKREPRHNRQFDRFSRATDQEHNTYNNANFDATNERSIGSSVNYVAGFDEVVRYQTDREMSEYDHFEKEIVEKHTSRFEEEMPPATRTYANRRHESIPV